MSHGRVPSGRSFAKVLGAIVAASAIGFFCAGCANPGPPKPPSLRLPAIPKDLQAERRGDSVLLHWTTPARTTDEMEITSSMTAELCREVGMAMQAPPSRATACTPIGRIAVNSGPSGFADTLPVPLQSGPPVLLTYRIQIFSSTGHTAGDSSGAYAASGIVPHRIEALRATASERGAILEWRCDPLSGNSGAHVVDLKRVELSELVAFKTPELATLRALGKTKPARRPEPSGLASEVHLRAAFAEAGIGGDTAGTVDTTARKGSTYTYVAERISFLTIGGHPLEIHSEPSAAVTLAMTDTFPPKAPTGLSAISGFTTPSVPGATQGLSGSGNGLAPYIDLSWEPNIEADLGGYHVYRQLIGPSGAPTGPPKRLTKLLLAAPAYRDIAVAAAQGYSYTVTAVDAAGNESAPSAEAHETVPPGGGTPPK